MGAINDLAMNGACDGAGVAEGLDVDGVAAMMHALLICPKYAA